MESKSLVEELAIQRTKLAEERTYLAYIRTGLSIILAGVFFIGYFSNNLFYVGLISIAVGAFFLVYGFYHNERSKVFLGKLTNPVLFRRKK